MKILRRIGASPHDSSHHCPSLCNCPDILELEDGDFAIIGLDATDTLKSHLAFGASCGPDERIVRIPRKTLLLAKADIPST